MQQNTGDGKEEKKGSLGGKFGVLLSKYQGLPHINAIEYFHILRHDIFICKPNYDDVL